MLKRLSLLLMLFTLFLSACGPGQPTEEADVDATVAAAVDATEAAAPTDTSLPAEPTDTSPPAEPTDTPPPPTATPEPEPSPTTETGETRILDLDEATLAFTPEEENFATELTFRLMQDNQVVSELVLDGVTNSNGDSAMTYDFAETEVAPTETTIEIFDKDDTTYFSLPDGTCISSGMADLPIADLARNTGGIVLDTENMVTGQVQWNGTTEVNGVSTNEYLIDVDNLVGVTGITNMTSGVLNVAEDGNSLVRLILEGSGDSELLAPGVTGELYYELNVTPNEMPFDIQVPEGCMGPGELQPGNGDGDDKGDDGGAEEPTVEPTGEIVIAVVGQSVSRQCQGEDVIVEGANNSITLTGNCNQVIVHSAGNTMDIESAAAIIVNGAGNNITYGGSPSITDNGLGNTLTQR